MQINRHNISSLILSVDLARTKAKIRRFRSGITFRKTSLMLGKQKTQRRIRELPLPVADEGSSQNWQQPDEYECTLVYEV